MGKTNSATTLATESASLLKYKGIYYFKLNPEYFLHRGVGEDEQKSCGLLGTEIDSNFHFLSGYDIKDVEVEDGILKIYRVNDEFEPIEVDISQEIGNPSFEYDPETGELKIYYPDGTSAVTSGFITDASFSVSTDQTLNGSGSKYNPLRLSPVEKTGQYAPVGKKMVIDDDNPMPTTAACGDRILTEETVNPFGLLYPYSAVEKIQSYLTANNSDWRIPTREDWDEMLNALETDEDERKHHLDSGSPCKGEEAGRLLKSSSDLWDDEERGQGLIEILPVGFVNDDNQKVGFGSRTFMWCYDEEGTDADVKEFRRNKNGVANDNFGRETDYKCSIRLVKDYTPGCTTGYEDILGLNLPTGVVYNCDHTYSKVWTMANLDARDENLMGELPGIPDGLNYEEKAFFINELNAEGIWHKKRMNEGDKVVVIEDGYKEYMLKDGELVDTFDDVAQAIETASDALNEKIEELSGITAELSGGVLTELSNMATSTGGALAGVEEKLAAVDAELSGNIETLAEEMEQKFAEAESAMTEAIAAEQERAEAKEDELAESIEGLTSGLTETNEKVNNVTTLINEHIEEFNVFKTDTEAAITAANDRITELSASTANSLPKYGDYVLEQDEIMSIPSEDNSQSVNISVADDFFSFGLLLPE